MKILILYKPHSETAREVEGFVRDYERHHDVSRLEIMDADSREGGALASLYDILQFPAILALASDGSLQKSWVGEEMPLMDEVAYYSSTGE